MTSLTIGGKEYKIEYGYNSFCDTDLMDRVTAISMLFADEDVNSDKDVSGMGKIKDLFCVVRELIYVGFEYHNPVESVQEVGKLLDQYKKETPEGEDRGLLALFTFLAEELANEGFLSDLLTKMSETPKQNKKKK